MNIKVNANLEDYKVLRHSYGILQTPKPQGTLTGFEPKPEVDNIISILITTTTVIGNQYFEIDSLSKYKITGIVIKPSKNPSDKRLLELIGKIYINSCGLHWDSFAKRNKDGVFKDYLRPKKTWEYIFIEVKKTWTAINN